MKKLSPLSRRVPVIAIGAVLAASAACSKSDEPAPKTDTILDNVYGDDYNEIFNRNRDGNIKEYVRSDAGDIVWSIYTWLNNGTAIIATDWTRDGVSTIYNDTVYFNRGLATYATGSQNGTGYRVDFAYQGKKLASVRWTQWNIADVEARRGRPWNWTNTLTWDGDNLAEYVDTQGGSPANTITSTYTWSALKTEWPFMVPFVVLPQYIPLQLEGQLGQLPANLIDTRTVATKYKTYDIIYSYTIKGQQITGYSEERDGKLLNRWIDWE